MNPTNDPPVITAQHPIRQGEMGLDSAHLHLGQPDQVTHWQRLLDAAIESTDRAPDKQFKWS